MKIAYFTEIFFPDANGHAVALNALIEKIASEGHEIAVYTHKLAKNPFKSSGIKVVNLPSVEMPWYRGFYFVIPNPFKLKRLIEKQNPDIIHVHSIGFLELLALVIARKEKVPAIATIHGFFFDDYANYTKGILSNLILRTDRVLLPGDILKSIVWCVYKAFYDRFDLVISPSKLTTKRLCVHKIKSIAIPYGADISLFRQKRSYRRTFRALSVGRVSFEKRIDFIIKAIAHIAKDVPKLRLTIAGDGPARKHLERLSKRLSLAEKITFTGHVGREKLQDYFDTHDFFATASSYDMFGLATAEAMAGGLPIVGIDVQGTGDIVTNNKNGYLVERDDLEGFALAMKKMADGKIDLKRMGTASRRIIKRFSVDKWVEKHIQLYDDLIGFKK